MPFAAILPMIMSAMSSQGGDKKGGGGGGFASSLPGTLEGVTSALGNIGQARAGNAIAPQAPAGASAESVSKFTPLQSAGVSNGHNPESIKAEPDKGLSGGGFKLSDERQKDEIEPSGNSAYSDMRAAASKIRGMGRW